MANLKSDFSTYWKKPSYDQGFTVGEYSYVGAENALLAYVTGAAMPKAPIRSVATADDIFPGWNSRAVNTVSTTSDEMVTLYRNFGPNELKSIQSSNGFSIGTGFAGKQFWIGEEGWNWWKTTDFAKPHNASLSIPRSYITPGNSNYIFTESGYELWDGIPYIDGYPGGTVAPQKLEIFNKATKFNWIK